MNVCIILLYFIIPTLRTYVCMYCYTGCVRTPGNNGPSRCRGVMGFCFSSLPLFGVCFGIALFKWDRTYSLRNNINNNNVLYICMYVCALIIGLGEAA